MAGTSEVWVYVKVGTVGNKERALFPGGMKGFFIDNFCYGQEIYLVVLMVICKAVQILLQGLDNPFSLPICLWVMCRVGQEPHV